ncbi:MAG TPA: hypothetical protein VKM55_10020 [Candidatus Lokiarchaeia archaeon]|nr:hypothetical protein [Candidatus Lokiarchaeia archaeon]
MEENVTIHARPSGKTIIEENVTIGHAAVLHNCIIHAGALIGMNATVSDFADIGEGAIVAEGAVVKRKSVIAPNMIAAGIPASEIGPVPEINAKIASEGATVYADLAKQYPKKLRPLLPNEYLTSESNESEPIDE